MNPNLLKTRFLPAVAVGLALLSCGAAANAQVVITEFLSDDLGGNAEFIEIYNSGMANVGIGGFTIADEEAVGGGEGAYSFPAGTRIAAGEVIVATSDALMLTAGANNPPALTRIFEWSDSDSDASNDLIKNDTLATGNITLSNGGDEIQLLDASDAIIDGIAYGGNALAPYPTVGAPGDDLTAIRQNLDNQPAQVADWMSDQVPTPGVVPFIDPNATCADDPCGVNEDCSGVAGSIVCECTSGFVEDALGACIESCTTLACTLAGQVCNTTTELCECDSGTTDYGNGACISPATITCDEDNLGYGFLGQAGDDTIPNGGCLTDDLANLDDAGLDALFTALNDATAPQDGVVLAPAVSITGAIIAATDDVGGKGSFYVQDSNGTIAVSVSGSAQPPFDIRVGQKVSFDVSEVESYFGNPQISEASNWAILSDGNFVAAPTPTTALVDADAARMVHLSGVALESRGEDGPCNDGQCYRIESADAVSIVVRAADTDITLGSRVEIVAPLELRGDLGAQLVNTFTNGFWANIQDPECTVDGDCSGTDETCVNFACQGPAPTDECDDTTTPCTETGEICDTVASPTVCVCDEDNLYVDDGNGVCELVECVGDVDCAGDFQVCTTNACACDAGYEDVSTTGDLDCQLVAGPTCGDGTCDTSEDETSCPDDCSTSGPTCGDGTCDTSEDETSCPDDCSTSGPTCGDGTCDSSEDETSCPDDCSTSGPTCGDGICNGGETAKSCPEDCDDNTSGSVCGDGVVTGDEECDGGARCSNDCSEVIVVGGGGGGDCSSTSGGGGLPASLLIALGLLAGVTRRRKLS